MSKYIVFQEDGSSSEYNVPPEPANLKSFMYQTGEFSGWYHVTIYTGRIKLEWSPVADEWIPPGIRLLCMLVR